MRGQRCAASSSSHVRCLHAFSILCLLQAERFTCLDLQHLRPAVPIVPAEPLRRPEAKAAVPALTSASLHSGGCYEFNLLALSDSSGQRAAYVPAVLLHKKVAAARGSSSSAPRKQPRAQRDRGIDIERLASLQAAQERAAVGDSKQLILTLFWAGVRGAPGLWLAFTCAANMEG